MASKRRNQENFALESGDDDDDGKQLMGNTP